MRLTEFTIPNQIKLADGMAGQSRLFTVGVNATRIEHDGFSVSIDLKGGKHDGQTLLLTPMGHGFVAPEPAKKSKAAASGAVQ